MLKLKLNHIVILIIGLFAIGYAYCYTQLAKAEKELSVSKENYTELKALIAQIPPEKPKTATPKTSLFLRLNGISEKLGLSKHIGSINPSPTSENYSEKLEIQLSNIYLEQCIEWINSWQSYPDVKIEQLSIQKNNANLFQVSMSILRYE